MPTKNPRVNVTLKPSTAAVLARMSRLTKNSQSAIIGELLETSEPVFERIVRVLEAAQQATHSVKDHIKANLEAAEGILDKQLGLMLGDMETRSADAVDALEAIHRRANNGGSGSEAPLLARSAGGGAGSPATPLSNRGVGKRAKTVSRGRRHKGKGHAR